MQAVILAGGLGTRLRDVSGGLPKPLVSVNGEPLLSHMLSHIAKFAISKVIILAGYEGKKIQEFCNDGSKWGLELKTIVESSQLGTAGAVLSVADQLDENFLVLYGDTLINFDINRMIYFHRNYDSAATLFLHPNDHPQDSDLVEIDDCQVIQRFHPYPHPEGAYLPNLVNAGAYIIRRSSILEVDNLPEKPDFGRHLFPRMLDQHLQLRGYVSPEYIKDAGTPERLNKVAGDILSGRVENSSLAKASPGIFIDRDGTIIKEVGHLSRLEDIHLIEGVSKSLCLLNQLGVRTALITNQPVVARGECNEEQLKKIHNKIEYSLGVEGAYLDRIYYCPHHPDKGFEGERLDLKIDCGCRKPKTGLIEHAVADLNIDLEKSWMIGDSTTDLMTARNSGLRSILVRTGFAGMDGTWPCLPDFEVPTFCDAVDFILSRWPKLEKEAMKYTEMISSGNLILVGGNSRAGKSSFSSVLAEVLRKNDIPAVVVPMDCWLLGESNRLGGAVIERYDMGAICAFVSEAKSMAGKMLMPKYNKYNRTSTPNGIEINIPKGAAIIVEGVPALMHSSLKNIADLKIYIEKNEKARIHAVKNEYKMRGWNEVAIQNLIEERVAEEYPAIEKTKIHADFVINI